jgi:hypothetical protein
MRRFLPRLPLLFSLMGLALWWVGVRSVDTSRITDLGLVTALPLPALLAPVFVGLGFLMSLRRRPLQPVVLAAHLAALIVVLYGATAMVQSVPGYRVVWRHAGVIEYVSRTGGVDPSIDAYFNWPGFFVLVAFISDVTGLKSALDLAPWAPVFFNLLYLGPLFMIFRSCSSDRRLAWLAAWFFLLSNWVVQDYLAPQALAYFIYLVILAVVLRWFSPARTLLARALRGLPPAPGERPADESSRLPAGAELLGPAGPVPSPRQRMVMMGILVVLFAAAVPSHQLTPFATLAAVAALVLARRCTARNLPVLMGVMIATWITFMTTKYLASHLEELVAQVGELTAVAASNVADRIQGSPDHLRVVRIRMAMSGALWSLAAFGWWRRRRQGHDDRALAVLGVAPFPLLALQSYGGEMLLRVYLFSLPFSAFFAATLVCPRPLNRPQGRSWAAVALSCLVLMGGFYFTRYGNERLDQFTTSEVAAVQELYQMAPPGSLLLAGAENLPWKSERYEAYTYRNLKNLTADSSAVDAQAAAELVLDEMKAHRKKGAYFIVTRSQRNYVNALGILPPGSLDTVESALRASPDVRLAYANADARIYTINQEGTAR